MTKKLSLKLFFSFLMLSISHSSSIIKDNYPGILPDSFIEDGIFYSVPSVQEMNRLDIKTNEVALIVKANPDGSASCQNNICVMFRKVENGSIDWMVTDVLRK